MNEYLVDVLNQLIEEALSLRGTAKTEFDKGTLFGYYHAISRMLNQAETFNIARNLPPRLRDFNPEDLL